VQVVPLIVVVQFAEEIHKRIGEPLNPVRQVPVALDPTYVCTYEALRKLVTAGQDGIARQRFETVADHPDAVQGRDASPLAATEA